MFWLTFTNSKKVAFLILSVLLLHQTNRITKSQCGDDIHQNIFYSSLKRVCSGQQKQEQRKNQFHESDHQNEWHRPQKNEKLQNCDRLSGLSPIIFLNGGNHRYEFLTVPSFLTTFHKVWLGIELCLYLNPPKKNPT